MDTLSRIFRALVFGIIALVGLVMAVVLTLSTIVALMILYVTAKFRARPFNAQEYWTMRQARRKSPFRAGIKSRTDMGSRGDVTDVEARDIP